MMLFVQLFIAIIDLIKVFVEKLDKVNEKAKEIKARSIEKKRRKKEAMA